MGSATLGIASAGMAALGTSNADTYGAEVASRDADIGKLKATQTNAQLTRNMSMTLANMDAVRAAAHDSDSPTGAAVRNQVGDTLTSQKTTQVDSIGNQVLLDESKASYLKNASQMALLNGGFNMLASAEKSFSGLPGLQGG